MDDQLRQLCQEFLGGQLAADQMLRRSLQLASQASEEAQVDVQRATRCGYPEVIFAEGKAIPTLIDIVKTIHGQSQSVLATRVSEPQSAALRETFPEAVFHPIARTFRLPTNADSRSRPTGRVAVITAGTSDLPVACEAQETLRWMNVELITLNDIGVAGPHRLPAHLDRLQDLDAVVVVAGMEGALPSVVGGYLSCPVFAVPTSVGYGASFHGIAALLGMLNSCAANVAVVNIDAGFKGGYLAGMIARQRHRQAPTRTQESTSKPGREDVHAW